MKLVSRLFAASALIAMATPAAAQLTTYTSRTTFNAAAGPLTTETFNSVTTDTSFQTTPAVFGDLSVAGFGTRQFDRNFVDAQPLQAGVFNVDGTTVLNAVTAADGGLTFTFSRAITAFGADFAQLQDDFIRTTITAAGRTVTPPQQSGDTVFFYGFTSTTAFTTVTFNGTGGATTDGFAIDNVSFSAAATGGAVPEPATWAMMIAGFGAVGCAMRRARPNARALRTA